MHASDCVVLSGATHLAEPERLDLAPRSVQLQVEILLGFRPLGLGGQQALHLLVGVTNLQSNVRYAAVTSDV